MLFDDKKWKRIPVEQVLTRLSDRVVCVAQSIKRHLVSVGHLPSSVLDVIPNGVPTKELLRLPLRPMQTAPVLFSAGRLAYVKGYDLRWHEYL